MVKMSLNIHVNLILGVDIQKLAENYQKECSYEPELHPGATFKIAELKATLKLFTTGSITLTAPSVQAAQTAIKQIYPILVEFKRSFPDQTNGSNASVVKSEPLQQQQQMENKVFKSNFMNGMSTTPVVKSEAIDLKPPVQLHTFSNFNYYNNVSLSANFSFNYIFSGSWISFKLFYIRGLNRLQDFYVQN